MVLTGSRVIFGSIRKGVLDLLRAMGRRCGTPRRWSWNRPRARTHYDWSPDGKWIVFAVQQPSTARDLWALPMTGEKDADRGVGTPLPTNCTARFSATGRWVVYQSSESGRFEIYVEPVPRAR